MKELRIVFMGTASFSNVILKRLISEKYNVVGVVSQPDRKVGRKKEVKMPEVKELALQHNIEVVQPNRVKEEYQMVLDLKPDLIITAAYGQIVPEAILNYPKLGCVNVHASLLPKYRGGAPIHQAIIDGQSETGVTIMYMVKKMDAGNIISQAKMDILVEDDTGILYDKLGQLGAELLLKTLPDIINGTNQSIKQNEDEVTYAPIITREQEKIDFNKDVKDVYNQVRGLNPWPGAFTTYEGKVVKIWAGKIHECENAMTHHAHQLPGTIVKIFNDGIGIKTGTGIYLATQIQLDGKKKMLVKDYLNGNNIFKVDTKFE